ncbi:MAG: class I SAM-dependent methyltransferase [Burkholderiales bacterium]|nr:class I SAM-dependent methyltransferase [Burkholderiales bacterium]
MNSAAKQAAIDPRLAAMIAPELDPAYRRRVATVMRWLPPSADADSHLVDIGCGRGYFIHYYTLLGQHAMTGVEFDARIAGMARRALAGRERVQIVRAAAGALPLADQSCSGAVMSEILEHVPDDVAALREAWRVLRPGGVVAVTVPHARYPWLWDPFNRTLQWLRLPPIRRGSLAGIWAEHLRLYDIATLRGVAQRAGFEIEQECSFVRWCLPFSHNLLYGVGKPLLESGWLPKSAALVIDRHRVPDGVSAAAGHAPAAGGPSRLARALHALMNVGERWNADDQGVHAATVNLCIKLRKPA